MSDKFDTLRAAWPMLSRAITSGQILLPQCHLVEPDTDVQSDYDVKIPTSEGYSLTCNVFRSKRRLEKDEATPVIMSAHPYDNHLIPALSKTPLGGPPQQYRLIPQPEPWPTFSTLTSWEAPDPDFWVRVGYSVVNVNLPGYANSEGPPSIMSEHQGRCFAEAVEWVARQSWCDGNVGLCGVSYLAISQYHAARFAGPALKCICPWEGVSDLYRDLVCGGGVNDVGFLDFWWHTEVKEPLQSREELVKTEGCIPSELLELHPLFDEYWRGKKANLEEIEVPVLVCGSFSDHELHTTGSFPVFEEVSSRRKWIYTHRGGKWSAFYSKEVLGIIKDFMDCFLKGVQNQFAQLQPVRLEVRSTREDIHEVRWEVDWPLPRTTYRQLFLDGKRLTSARPDTSDCVSYSANGGSVTFDHVFDGDTELSGYMKLKLWVEARPERAGELQPDDMVLCVYADKRDRAGRSVRFNGSVGSTDDVVTRGYCRVSRRALDEGKSTPWKPVLLGTTEEKLSAREIVPVEIALRPSSTFFAKGERISLIVSSKEAVRSPIFRKDVSANTGRHVVYFGGEFDSHLLTPEIPELPE